MCSASTTRPFNHPREINCVNCLYCWHTNSLNKYIHLLSFIGKTLHSHEDITSVFQSFITFVRWILEQWRRLFYPHFKCSVAFWVENWKMTTVFQFSVATTKLCFSLNQTCLVAKYNYRQFSTNNWDGWPTLSSPFWQLFVFDCMFYANGDKFLVVGFQFRTIASFCSIWQEPCKR